MRRSREWDRALELLLDKLYLTPGDYNKGGFIDLLALTSDDPLPRGLLLSPLELNLLKGAVPGCIAKATSYPNELVTVEGEGGGDSSLRPTPLDFIHRVKVPSNLAGKTQEIVLVNAGKEVDITSKACLFVTRRALRNVFDRIPYWAIWNKCSPAYRKKLLKDSRAGVRDATTGRRHERCKDAYQQQRRMEEEPPQVAAPKRTPAPPYLQKTKPKNSPSTRMLKMYCKHFHVGRWLKEYEAILDDWKECTFQPNLHRYLKHDLSKVPPEGLPFALHRLMEESEEGGSLMEEEEKSVLHSLRHEYHTKCVKPKAKRFPPHKNYNDYIRLSDRSCFAVCVPDYSRLEKLRKQIEEAALAKEERSVSRVINLKNGLSRRLRARHYDPFQHEELDKEDLSAVTMKSPIEDYILNERRNLMASLREGLAVGAFTVPKKIVALPFDPLKRLESKIEKMKPKFSHN